MTRRLVHVSELGSDYFHFDPTKHQMLGEHTGKRYRLGDRVRVRVVRVDMESTKIDFVLEMPQASAPGSLDTEKMGAWGETPHAPAPSHKKGKKDKGHHHG